MQDVQSLRESGRHSRSTGARVDVRTCRLERPACRASAPRCREKHATWSAGRSGAPDATARCMTSRNFVLPIALSAVLGACAVELEGDELDEATESSDLDAVVARHCDARN